MKTIVLILAMALGSITQASEWTALVATQGAMVTIDKSIAPAPVPTPIGNPAKHGKITLDIRVPAACPSDGSCRNGLCPLRSKELTPPAGNPQNPSTTGGDCPGGVCGVSPTTERVITSLATNVAARRSGGASLLSANTRTRWRLFRR